MREILRSRARDDSIELSEGQARHGDGTIVQVVASGNLDLDATTDGQRSAIVNGFAALCRTIACPVQIIVRNRLSVAAPSRDTDCRLGIRRDLVEAMESHWHGAPRCRRQILFVARDADVATVERTTRALAGCCRAAGTTARVLDADAIGDVLAESGVTRAPAWRSRPSHASRPGRMFSGHVLTRLPGHAVHPGWVRPLLTLPIDYDVAIHLTPVSVGQALSRLNRHLRQHNADRLIEIERGVDPNPLLDVALSEGAELRDRIATNSARPLWMTLVVGIHASDRGGLQEGQALVRSAIARVLAAATPTHFRHWDALMSVLPLGRNAVGGAKLVDSASAATLVPWVWADVEEAGGYRLGRNGDSGAPVRVDPFDSARYSNANVAVLGASGQGKSYAVGGLILEAVAAGTGCIVLDPEGEYEGLIRRLGGEYLQLVPGSTHALNVFDIGVDNTSGAGETDIGAVVTELVSVLCGQLNEVDRARIHTAARVVHQAARSAGRVPVLGDCRALLEASVPHAAVVLDRFCEGPLGHLFNRPTSVDLDQPLVGISLRDIGDDLVAATSLLVGHLLWNRVRRRPERRHLIFDEVGTLSIYPALRRLLELLARRCRKYGASLVVATQNARDLLDTPEGSVVVTNCSTVLLGGHRSVEVERIGRALGLSDRHEQLIETAPRGSFLLVAGNLRLPLEVEMPPLHHSLLTTGVPLDRGCAVPAPL